MTSKSKTLKTAAAKKVGNKPQVPAKVVKAIAAKKPVTKAVTIEVKTDSVKKLTTAQAKVVDKVKKDLKEAKSILKNKATKTAVTLKKIATDSDKIKKAEKTSSAKDKAGFTKAPVKKPVTKVVAKPVVTTSFKPVEFKPVKSPLLPWGATIADVKKEPEVTTVGNMEQKTNVIKPDVKSMSMDELRERMKTQAQNQFQQKPQFSFIK